ncbi:MAG: HAMP domain-containing sensor histidine kinase [Pseudomonadota bacterium]
MNPGASRLISRAIAVELVFTLAVSALLASLTSHFLVLSGQVALEGAEMLAQAVLAAGALSLARSFWRLRRYRFLLRSLSVGSRAVEARELYALSDEPQVVVFSWLAMSVSSILLFHTVLRPKIIDFSTGTNLALLGVVIVAAASLPMFVVVRSTFLRALELAPPEIMREVVEDANARGVIALRVPRRLVAAVTTPVVFLIFGCALIVSSHLRRADEHSREETARVLARASLELRPGVVSGAGLEGAIAQGKALGFSAAVRSRPDGYHVERGDDGIVTVVTPLDEGSAEVRFKGSVVGLLSASFVLVALLGTGIASGLGVALGHALAQDLRVATQDVRELGTDAVLSGGTHVVRSARFRVVARLGLAIERLAARFRVFAKAQERAITARKATARMRGLFFASVSHDLKSPLNAILGFTELVRKSEELSAGQSESLSLIDRRGRELLALIETILDAARVDAGQLSLLVDQCDVRTLFAEAVAKGKDLGGDRGVEIFTDISPGVTYVRVDRVRMPRALATFIGHAVRVSESAAVHVQVVPDPEGVRFDVEVPGSRVDAHKLEALLDPSPALGPSEHRGLALGLRLARSVVELHGGSVVVTPLSRHGAVFSILLPTHDAESRLAPPISTRM